MAASTVVTGPGGSPAHRCISEPDKTREVIDDEGWLRTGDIGSFDSEGFLTIIDRNKEMIINAAGKNMSPANIDNSIKAATPLIGAIAVIGDGRPFNTALIVLDAESAHEAAADHIVAQHIQEGVAAGNQRLSRVER